MRLKKKRRKRGGKRMRSSGGRRRNYKETWNTTHSERLVLGHHSEMVEGIL
jgi:hypothetical protein